MVTNVMEAEVTNVAFERLKYFVNEEMDSTVFINSSESEAIGRYIDAGIKVTTLPKDPVDQIVGVMLFHKLNAIMEERISVLETELSSHLGDNMVYIHSENETAEDVEIPGWWLTPDLTHHEIQVEDRDQIYPLNSSVYALWSSLNLGWPGEAPTETGNIVFADFGKDETK
jgi:hypothetical protein